MLISASLVPFTSGNIAHARQALAKSCVTAPPPAFAGASKKYSGQTIIYYGDAVGCGHDMDMAAVSRFTKDTGIKVKVIQKPSDSNEAYSTYSRLFGAHSSNIDVMMLDVIWPSAFGQNLLDLKPKFGSQMGGFYSSIVQNDTIGGHLVAIPWFADFGMLYYRTDLLKKYHISSPPTTWEQLGKDAKKIQAGEQKSNKSFYGFVFQGKAYEGLTCNALEWLAGSGGGKIIEGGKVTLNNPKAAKILNLIKGFVGTVSPRDVTTYTETESDNAFNNGNAAFMRNWPYAYAAAQLAKIKGKVAAAPLPHEAGYKSSGTVGGWQLGVSKDSKHPQASMELVRYLTSAPVETWRAVVASFVPSRPAVARKASVIKAMPFLKTAGVSEARVTRPSRFLGTKYNQGSNVFWSGVSQILNGQDASSVLSGTAQQLQRLAH
ncbi:MAG: ABC transporter substrate-binding protein [Chloroflexota bacterium]